MELLVVVDLLHRPRRLVGAKVDLDAPPVPLEDFHAGVLVVDKAQVEGVLVIQILRVRFD